MKVAVIGSREFNDYDLLEEILSKEKITDIISGAARGADTLARIYARRHGINLIEYIPDWKDISHPDALIKTHADGQQYDALAGIRRNTQIIEESDCVIAFWDGLEKGSGTFDGIKKAKKLGKQIKIIKYLLF